jgi:hypothetical protein
MIDIICLTLLYQFEPGVRVRRFYRKESGGTHRLRTVKVNFESNRSRSLMGVPGRVFTLATIELLAEFSNCLSNSDHVFGGVSHIAVYREHPLAGLHFFITDSIYYRLIERPKDSWENVCLNQAQPYVFSSTGPIKKEDAGEGDEVTFGGRWKHTNPRDR